MIAVNTLKGSELFIHINIKLLPNIKGLADRLFYMTSCEKQFPTQVLLRDGLQAAVSYTGSPT